MDGLYVLGSVVFDVAVRSLDALPAWGSAANLDSITLTIGGNGAATACAASKLGASVRVAGAVGDDAAAESVVNGMREHGVDVSLLGRTEAGTAKTVALVHPGGERLFLQELAATAALGIADVRFDASAVENRGWFHYGSPFCLTGLRADAPRILNEARKAGMRTSMDLDWDPRQEWLAFLEPLLPLLDMLFLNEEEARAVTGLEDPEAACRFLQERGVSIVVVKLGARGCGVLEGNVWSHQPAPAVQVVDTTGAGDCFCGAYLHAVLQDQSHRDCARLAVAAASLSVERQGNVESLPSRDSLDERLRQMV